LGATGTLSVALTTSKRFAILNCFLVYTKRIKICSHKISFVRMPAEEDSRLELKEGIRNTKSPDADNALVIAGRKIGRPPKSENERYKSTHIRLHPMIVEWAKAEAERRGVGYQSVINETLIEHIVS
jgi:uncharacterized protein (DUF4415 family)